MTKPRNMTSEQEAAWRDKERLRRSSPEYKEAAARRARKYYERNKELVISRNVSARSSYEGRSHRNKMERSALAASPERREKASRRQKEWQSTTEGKKKNRAKSARYARRVRLDRQFDAFMAAIAKEEASC